MRRRYTTLTIAGILIVVSLSTACRSDTGSHATTPVSPSVTASLAAGRSQPSTLSGAMGSAPAAEVLIVWHGDEGGNSHLWLVRTDGGEPRRLIADEGRLLYESWPQWSPDGSRIAFIGMTSATGQDEIHVIDADGSNLRQLTESPDGKSDVAWSPDGKQIAFSGWDEAGTYIGVIAADGSTHVRLTDGLQQTGMPAWSPDGKQIAFSGGDSGATVIYIMEADGSNPRQITTETLSNAGEPVWSPDGSRIAFMGNGFDDMFLIDADGTNLVSLAALGAWGHTPRWSPDGRTIAFIGESLEFSEEIFLIDSSGRNVRQLTADGSRNIYHDWSEDGAQIVWAAQESPSGSASLPIGQLHISDSDGSAHRVIFSGARSMMTPKWRPTGMTADPLPQPTWPPDLGTPVPTRTPTPPYVPTFDTSGPPWPGPEPDNCDAGGPPSDPGVYVMNPNGSDVKTLFRVGQTHGDNVVWSPDGRLVTFVGSIPPETVEPGVTPTADADGNIPGPTHGIFQRDIASGADTMLVEIDGVDALAWSSDGMQLALTQREYDESTERYWLAIVNADGSDLRRVAELPGGLNDVALSFTGGEPRLAYAFDGDIWVIHADGSGPINMTNSLEDEFEPTWSPHGEVLFRRWNGEPFDDTRGYPYQLHSVQADGTSLRVLDLFASDDRQPNWSPDGRQVAFVREGEIWVMNADGSDPRNMTQHLAPDTFPVWSPDGSQILFRSFRGEGIEPLRQPGQPRPIVLRHAGAEQAGMFMTACWVTVEYRTVGSSGAVVFPVEPLLVADTDGADVATIQLDFNQLGEPGTVSISIYDLVATRANGKGFGEDAIILPCAAPGGVEESCRVLHRTEQPASVVDIELALPAGDYVIVVHSNVVSGTEYGYVEQTFHVRVGP